MSALTLPQLRERLDAYLAAETKVLQSQQYTIGQGATARTLRRADLAEIRAEIKSLQAQIANHPDNRTRRRRITYLRPL